MDIARELVIREAMFDELDRRVAASGDGNLSWDDAEAKQIVMGLVDDAGYQPVDLGGVATCAPMEAPRREGAVYGEEYYLDDAAAVVEAVRGGRPIPPTPSYAAE